MTNITLTLSERETYLLLGLTACEAARDPYGNEVADAVFKKLLELQHPARRSTIPQDESKKILDPNP